MNDKQFRKGHYTCVFYDDNSFSLFKDGEEVMHTFSYSGEKTQKGFEDCIKTYEMLIKVLPNDNKYYAIN